MKKLCGAVCALLLLFAFCGNAYAATFQVTTDPAEVTGPGSIKIRFSVTNDSTHDMRNISASGYGIGSSSSLSSQVIQPGAQLNFTIPGANVTQDMLGSPLTYTISWTENGEQKSQNVAVMIGGGAQQAADMSAQRTASKVSGKEGDTITLTYTLKNPGQVPMTDITVKDTIAGSAAIASGLSLAAEGTQTVTYDYTLGSKDAVSQPTITYVVNGEKKTLALEAMTLTLSNIHLAVDVTKSDPTPEGTQFTIVLKNDGNQSISSITVTDEQANKVNADSFTLEAGAEKTLGFVVQTETVRNVSFTIKGKDALGQPYENSTKNYEVRPYVDPSKIKVSLVTNVIEPLSDNGRMKVRFVIQNDSSVDLTSAVISEGVIGNLITRDVLALGETIIEEELRVGEPRELEFTLTTTDPSGTAHERQSKLTAAYVDVSTPAPEATLPPQNTQAPEEPTGLNSTLLTVLIVLAALMALAGIALLVLSIYEKKRNASMQDFDDADAFAPPPAGGGKRKKSLADEDVDLSMPPQVQQHPRQQARPQQQPQPPRPQPQPPRPQQQPPSQQQQRPPQPDNTSHYQSRPQPRGAQPVQEAQTRSVPVAPTRVYTPRQPEEYYQQQRQQPSAGQEAFVRPVQPAQAGYERPDASAAPPTHAGAQPPAHQPPAYPQEIVQDTPVFAPQQQAQEQTQARARNRVHRVQQTDDER